MRTFIRFVITTAILLGATVAAIVVAMGSAFAMRLPDAPPSMLGVLAGAAVHTLLAPLTLMRRVWPASPPEGYGYADLLLNSILWSLILTALRAVWRAHRPPAAV